MSSEPWDMERAAYEIDKLRAKRAIKERLGDDYVPSDAEIEAEIKLIQAARTREKREKAPQDQKGEKNSATPAPRTQKRRSKAPVPDLYVMMAKRQSWCAARAAVLSLYELRVTTFLNAWPDMKKYDSPASSLAACIGLSEIRTSRALASLVKKGYVRRTKRAGTRSWTYWFSCK